jgi:FkbM family methyltransferase
VYEALGSRVFRRPFRGRDIGWKYTDVGFVWEIFELECYTAAPGMEIHEDDVVVDAGAHVGTFSIFAAVAAPNGRVIAVEPCHAHFLRLLSNVQVNRLSNVIPVNAALASWDGAATLWKAPSGSGSNSLVRVGSETGEPVQVVSLHTLISRFNLETVGFLKLDIEGAEYDLFLEHTAWLRKVRRIALEAHSRFGNPHVIVNSLKDAGFCVTWVPVTRSPSDLQIYAVRPGEYRA